MSNYLAIATVTGTLQHGCRTLPRLCREQKSARPDRTERRLRLRIRGSIFFYIK